MISLKWEKRFLISNQAQSVGDFTSLKCIQGVNMRDCCRRAEPNFCSTLRLKLSCDQNTLSSHLTHVTRCLLAPVRRVRTDLIRAQYSAIPQGLNTSSAWALLFDILLLKVFYTLKFSASTLIWCQTAACRGFFVSWSQARRSSS